MQYMSSIWLRSSAFGHLLVFFGRETVLLDESLTEIASRVKSNHLNDLENLVPAEGEQFPGFIEPGDVHQFVRSIVGDGFDFSVQRGKADIHQPCQPIDIQVRIG